MQNPLTVQKQGMLQESEGLWFRVWNNILKGTVLSKYYFTVALNLKKCIKYIRSV